MTIHAAALPRQFPAPIQVAAIGWAPQKRGIVDREFKTYNFSILLSGTGHYRVRGQAVPVSAPAVITQAPGRHVHYGPRDHWSELYIIFPSQCADALRRENLWQDDSWWWPLTNAATVQNEINSLLALMEAAQNSPEPEHGIADKLDRAALTTVLECRLHEGSRSTAAGHTAALHAVQKLLEHSYDQSHDIDTLARQHDLSPTHFRRLWQAKMGCSPQQYAHQVRMRAAARMLVASDLSIQDIAHNVGFNDPLYFSKRFRAYFNLSPSVYRQFYQDSLSQS
jgi:AraC family transcriptional regulator of arabinose operon